MTTPQPQQEPNWRDKPAKFEHIHFEIVLGAILIIIVAIGGSVIFPRDDGYWSNFYMTVLGVLITVLILDRLAQIREEQREEQELKAQLIRDIRSDSSEVAKNAVHQIRERNWLDENVGLLAGIQLGKANLRQANLKETDLWGVNLMEANLEKANLQGAELVNANMQHTRLWQANLQGTDLTGACLYGAYLSMVNLQNAYLVAANLQQTHLTNANLEGANLQDTDLTGADLRGANLQKSKSTKGCITWGLSIQDKFVWGKFARRRS